jgi:dipeptidase D
MTLKTALLTLLVSVSCLQHSGTAGERALVNLLNGRAQEFVMRAEARSGGDGPLTFTYFTGSVTEELRKLGEDATADLVSRGLNGQVDPSSHELFAWMLHAYAREFYRDNIVSATSRLIRFRTFATDVPNRENPEFIRQKEYLRELAGSLGLGFRDVDGYVQEIWVGGGEKSFGLMSHSDVQPVEEKSWDGDPWSGEVTDSVIRGRGAIDDKGAIAAIMYGMRALLDSRLPLKNKLILLVGTDEESANEDISTYLKTNPAPTKTAVVDFAYPVFCAEKGWCGVWMKAGREADTLGSGLNVVDIRSGFSPSIVPGDATAVIRPVGISVGKAEVKLKELASEFERTRQGAKLTVAATDSTLVVTAAGRSVHSSVPETGHNPLMDLLVWLDRDVRPVGNSLSLMSRFGAEYIGFELDGRTLGIAHTDSFMGDVSVAADMFRSDPDSVMFMFNFRIPKGTDLGKIRETIDGHLRDFSDRWKIGFSPQMYLSEPLYNDPDSPFVRRLLGIYSDVTGEDGTARSMGGGTYARRIPNAVVFGPGLDGEEYLGHQPNENISLRALTRNIEILTHALVVFGLE